MVERVPGKVHSEWVFNTTRAPVRFIATVEDGATVKKFLTRPPGVTYDQAEAVLEDAKRSLAVAWARKGSRSASRNTRCWRP